MDIRFEQPGTDVLRLERITVIVYDHESDNTVGDNCFEERFAADEKQELAKLIESTLTAPFAKRKILAKEDREMFELNELLRGLRYAQDVRWRMQRNNSHACSPDASADSNSNP